MVLINSRAFQKLKAGRRRANTTGLFHLPLRAVSAISSMLLATAAALITIAWLGTRRLAGAATSPPAPLAAPKPSGKGALRPPPPLVPAENRTGEGGFGGPPHRSGRSLPVADAGVIHLERTTYKLPHALGENLIDWEDAPGDDGGGRGGSLPVFWHVPRSAGTAVKHMYARCYDLVEACESGAAIDRRQREEWGPGSGRNGTLRVVTSRQGPKGAWQGRYVAVDVSTPWGILDASRLGFASSALADLMLTPLISDAAVHLLNGDRRGRMFAVLRHPAERVASVFHHLRTATWEPTYDPAYASWTVDDYARSPRAEGDWMVRTLVGRMEGAVDAADVAVAKEVLRRKCLVGLTDKMEESVMRFHRYFGFGDEGALNCTRKNFLGDDTRENSHGAPRLDRKSKTWTILEYKNRYDLMLFKYAQELFQEQGRWMKDRGLL